MNKQGPNEHARDRRAGSSPDEERVELLLDELGPVDPPPFYTERLLARVRAASRAPSWAERLRSPALAWSVAGACVIALVLVVVSANRGTPPAVVASPDTSFASADIDPLTPAANAVVGSAGVEIVAAIYPPVDEGAVRLYVDETDVTGLAEVTGSYVMYSPVERLEEGEHIITIEIRDSTGRSVKDMTWLFHALNGERQAHDDAI
jgi:hypothetical protein